MTETVKVVKGRGEDPRKGKRITRSESKFPYYDLRDSIKVATVLRERAGGSCSPDQLAPWLGHTGALSGAFVSRIAAAKQFGLIERKAPRLLRLSQRGRVIVAPGSGESVGEAKVAACLDVDLFVKVFEHFQGSTLPEKMGLQNVIQTDFGVVSGRAETAVRVLLNSAREAGFLIEDNKGMRMVKPIAHPTTEAVHDSVAEEPRRAGSNGGDGGNGGGGGIDPAIQGLLERLPPSGTPLARARRDALILAFTACIDFIYPTQEENERPQTSNVD